MSRSRSTTRILDARYELHAVIGRGGMGEVWAATDVRLSRPVAVKILSPHLAAESEARTRFEHEARAAAGLTDTHVVTVFDSGEDDGVPYLVMERLPGTTLADEIARGPLSVARAVALACQILDGLQCAHDAGIVHRDIKPGNVLLTEEGDARVADFGIAKAIESADATMTTELLASAPYLAPERILGDPATPSTDLFAVGVLLYEMLTGRRPFAGESPIAVLRAIEHNDHVPLRTKRDDLPPSLVAAVERALSADPLDRFESARAMALAIDPATRTPAPELRHTAGEGQATIPIELPASVSSTRAFPTSRTTPIAPRKRPSRRRAAASIAALVLVIGVVVVALVSLALGARHDTPVAPATATTLSSAAPISGPALPGPLERALQDLEKLVGS